MQTQCTHATKRYLRFDVGTSFLASLTTLRWTESPNRSVPRVLAEWNVVYHCLGFQ